MSHTCHFRFTMLAAATTIAMVSARASRADFIGNLQLLPQGCEVTGECRLGQNFGFIDSAGIGWQATKGLATDGASIPEWAKTVIGQSFEPAFIRAAVIHDHYCVRRVRPWRQTHKVFHEALLASGVSRLQAGIMYYGVLIGGPKWAKLVKGKPCPVGMGCIQQVDVTAAVRGASIGLTSDGQAIIKRAADFGSERFRQRFQEGLPKLLAAGNDLKPEDVEALAAQEMAGDFYFRNGDEVGTSLDVTIRTE